MLLIHTNYHAELQRTLTATSILPVTISMMITAFLQELLFRKSVCSQFAPYSIVTALVSTGLFFLFHMPTNLAHLFLYIGMGLALYSLPKKRKSIIDYLASYPMESFHLRCYNLSHNYSDVTEKTFSVFATFKFLSIKKSEDNASDFWLLIKGREL